MCAALYPKDYTARLPADVPPRENGYKPNPSGATAAAAAAGRRQALIHTARRRKGKPKLSCRESYRHHHNHQREADDVARARASQG